MKIKKIIAAALALTMSAITFTACGGAKSDDDGTIKIGGIGPLTGGAAIYGNAVKNAAEIAVEEVNALGGLQFSLKFEDDEHDAEKSVNAYNKLKDWSMDISLGTVTTTPCIAVSSELDADHIFALTPSASSTDVIGGIANESGVVEIPRKSGMFQMCFTDPNQGKASAEYIAEQNIATKIAVIYDSSDAYSTGIYNTFKTEADARGLELVSVTSFTADTATDFSVQLTEANNAGAELIFLPIYYTPASLILTQANSAGYDFKYFGVDGMDGILTLEGFDTSLAEGVMLLTPFVADADDAATQSFVKKYQERYGDIPNQFAADAYDCVYSIYEACKKAGITADMTSSEMCDKLIATFTDPSFVFNGLTGTDVTWSTTGEVSKAPKGMIIKNGAYSAM